jgi:hypothetical protein
VKLKRSEAGIIDPDNIRWTLFQLCQQILLYFKSDPTILSDPVYVEFYKLIRSFILNWILLVLFKNSNFNQNDF